jgi:IS5 family transposase
MLHKSPSNSSQSSFFDIASQLNQKHELVVLGAIFPWEELSNSFSDLYSSIGRCAKPIRLMSGLLILKQLYNLSDKAIISQWMMNPYFQCFCGETSFQTSQPCDSSELTVFRKRIGTKGVEKIFSLSVKLHGKRAQEETVLVDTTVQEKAVTYPTDSKLAIKIINRLNKLAKLHGIKQRRTYAKETISLRVACRNFRHPKLRKQAKKAIRRLRTIAGTLLRELQRKLPQNILQEQQENFEIYEKVLAQKIKDKNKIYSLHEPDIYCISKGKDHKPYEYGRKASVVTTLKNQIIVGVVSHDTNIHDSKTLKPALDAAEKNLQNPITSAVVDRGYKGAKQYVDAEVIIPSKPLKRDTEKQKKLKRKLCKKRSAIEPIIGHLKHDFRLTKNWLKGSQGDEINLLMAACAWNLRKWIVAFFFGFFLRLALNISQKYHE